MIKKIKSLFLRSRTVFLLIDALVVPVSLYLAYWLRFNLGLIPVQELEHSSYLLPFFVVVQVLSFWFFGLYRSIWKFASLPDFIRILKAVFVGIAISFIVLYFVPFAIPRSIMPIYAWLLVSFLGGTRFLYRWLKGNFHGGFKEGKRALVVGAGQAADLLLRELTKVNESAYNVVSIVDDDPSKIGCDIHGVRVSRGLDNIPEFIDKYDIELVIIAMPSSEPEIIRRVVDYCKDAEIEFRAVPSLNDIVSGNVSINTLHEVSVEDLLGREQVTLDWEGISKIINGKRVLVTGGGGSIGSELCRQVSYLSPENLVVVDNGEFNLYTIDKELRKKFPNLNLTSLLIDVVDEVAIQDAIKRYKPEIIFHAAAYKHVPLLEHQVRSAVRNNILGTYNMARASVDCGAPTFVLISTDKAVNPVNIMGATKRAAEVICQNFNNQGSTHFITVRFGNVLGSAGSVIPLFKEQLETGKDLTVTHPEVTRYFMTISEATQLILQATVLGENGEIFVLDMGDPIKIKDLAEQMIYLSGKKLGGDVNIKYIGLRPGEKLYEELFYDIEELLPTPHVKIRQSKYRSLDWKEVSQRIKAFSKMCSGDVNEDKIKEVLLKIVPEYKGDSN